MLSLGLNIGLGGKANLHDLAPAWLPLGASMYADFTTGDYASSPDGSSESTAVTAISDLVTCTRSAPGFATNADGTLQAFTNNQPRITDKGLLPETSATNLLRFSEEFDDTTWVKSNVSVTANQATAPDGTLTADMLTPSAAGAFIYQSIISPPISAVMSVWLKSASANNVTLHLTINGAGAIPNPQNLTLSVTPQWQRFSFPVATDGNTINYNIGAYGAGDVWSPLDPVHVWGAQFEQSTFASSYIKTQNATAIRAADAVQFSDLSWLAGGQGTFVIEFLANQASNYNYAGLIGIWQDNGNYIGINSNGANFNTEGKSAGNWSLSNLTFAFPADGVSKVALAYENNNVGFSLDGAAPILDTSYGAVSSAANVFIGDRLPSFYQQWNSYIRSITYYPVRKTDLELQALTV